MRPLLALLIGFALFMGPLAAAFVTSPSDMSGSAAMSGAGMHSMPGMTGALANRAGTDTGVDHTGKRGCGGQVCGAVCCTGAVLPIVSASPLIFVSRDAVTRIQIIAPRSHDPTGFDPPPKSFS
jgi:hypothetical protein